MRRLPIFFVLDCSESMVGSKLQEMEQGISSIVSSLRTDPHALETVFVSVIAFAGIAKTIIPLIDIISYYPAKLPLGGGTSLGSALEELMNNIDKNIKQTSYDQKGDWEPIVYLFTDGKPTDNFDQAINRWHSSYAKKTTVIAIGMGKEVDFSILNQITDKVLIYEKTNKNDFTELIRWVTASISVQSKSVDNAQKNESLLAIQNKGPLSLAKKKKLENIDDTCATFVGRCRKNKRPYIMRYDKETEEISSKDFNFEISKFQLTGCYPIDENYFLWTDNSASITQVNTNDLVGSPGCPHCGGITAFAVCSCGNFLCLDKSDNVICPWCEQSIQFGHGDGSGFNVLRGRG